MWRLALARRKNTLIKSFVSGILLSIAVSVSALYYIPIVNQVRENSMITVIPNVGNTEVFHANVPMDRIMIGAPRQASPLPVGLDWPDDDSFSGIRAELFKIRNANDIVVGVASRIAGSTENDEIVEWVLHLPARGSAYLIMEPVADSGGYRAGEMRAGTDEFGDLQGQAIERWVVDTSGDEYAPEGKIELITAFVAVQEEL
jgi:hypothetical protein